MAGLCLSELGERGEGEPSEADQGADAQQRPPATFELVDAHFEFIESFVGLVVPLREQVEPRMSLSSLEPPCEPQYAC